MEVKSRSFGNGFQENYGRMIFYFVIFVVFALLAFIEILGLKRRTARGLCVFFSVFLFALSFLRWERGTDWESYYVFFQTLESWNFVNLSDIDFEIGFVLVNFLVKGITDNYTFLLFVTGLILFIAKTTTILKSSIYPMVSLFILWATYFGNIFFVRQWIAVAILFYAIRFIQEKRMLPFIMMSFLATSFHRSAVVFFPAYYLYHMQMKISVMVLAIVVMMILGFVVGALFLQLVGGIYGEIFLTKVTGYIEGGMTYDKTDNVSSEVLILKAILNKGALLGVGILLVKKIETSYPQIRGYFNLVWFGTLVSFSTMFLSDVFVRFSYYFDFFQLLLIPFLFLLPKKVSSRVVTFACVMFYLGLRLYFNLEGNYKDLYIPFKTIWDSDVNTTVF